ncbi:MAG: hypothetical protein AB7O44_14790 [Hyphomicrobiaceae bacterium]
MIALVCIASANGVAEELRSGHQGSEDSRELVSDAAIIVPIIRASVGAYKARGNPVHTQAHHAQRWVSGQ